VAHTAAALFATDLAAVYWAASQKINMAEEGDTDMEYVYYKPADFVSITELNDDDAVARVEAIGIVSDTDALQIKYTYQCDTPTMYYAEFVAALAVRLAYELCFKFTESRPRAGDLLSEYMKLSLPQAKVANGKNSKPFIKEDNAWIANR
jgi:hypothetical protein